MADFAVHWFTSPRPEELSGSVSQPPLPVSPVLFEHASAGAVPVHWASSVVYAGPG